MKTFTLTTLSTLILSASALAGVPAPAKPTYVCGTGDFIAGVDLYASASSMKIVVLGQADNDSREYNADLTPAQQQAIEAGQLVTLTGESKDSFGFGGGTSHAVLLNLKLNSPQDDHFDRQSALAEQGDVIDLFCNRAK